MQVHDHVIYNGCRLTVCMCGGSEDEGGREGGGMGPSLVIYNLPTVYRWASFNALRFRFCLGCSVSD